MSDLELKLLNTLLDSNNVLLEACLIVLELRDLLLKPGPLGPLISIVALYLLLDAVQLVGQGLAGVLLLHGKNGLERFLLAAEDLHLLLVSVQVLLQSADRVVQVVQLALQVRGVVGARRAPGHHGLGVEGPASRRQLLLAVTLT